MSTKRKLVMLEWVDSCGPHGWNDRAAIEKDYSPDHIRSIGWVLREDRKSITIGAHLSTSQVDGVICIPKVAITSRKTVSET